MESISTIIELINKYGGIALMAVLFIIIFFDDRKNYKDEKKKNSEVMQALADSNNNIAESLNLLKTSMDIQNNKFQVHDERDIKNYTEIKEHLVRIESVVSK